MSLLATHTFSDCGCSADIHESDLPVHSIHCEHGGFITPARHDGTITGSILIAEQR